ncbi:MAG TPA: hypothetical protein VHZ07_18110 [Bryobacteraceae bacterium]|nr:hypothetical protein [Bryobacteraceae bacterium]
MATKFVPVARQENCGVSLFAASLTRVMQRAWTYEHRREPWSLTI